MLVTCFFFNLYFKKNLRRTLFLRKGSGIWEGNGFFLRLPEADSFLCLPASDESEKDSWLECLTHTPRASLTLVVVGDGAHELPQPHRLPSNRAPLLLGQNIRSTALRPSPPRRRHRWAARFLSRCPRPVPIVWSPAVNSPRDLGLGMITPLGCGVETTWRRLVEGQCGVRALSPADLRMDNFDEATVMHTYDQLTSKVAAIVPCGNGQGQFDEQLWLQSKVKKKKKGKKS